MAGYYDQPEPQPPEGGYYGELHQTPMPPAEPTAEEQAAIDRLASQGRNFGSGLNRSGPMGLAEEGRQMADLEDQAEAGDAYAEETLDERFDAPPPAVEADPIPPYLTREGQRALTAPQRAGARVGGMAYRPVEATSNVYFDRQLEELQAKTTAEYQRIKASDVLTDRQKAQETAKLLRRHDEQKAVIEGKRDAHNQTLPGKFERQQMLTDEGVTARLEGQAADTKLVQESQEDRASMMRQEAREQRDLRQQHVEDQRNRRAAVENAQNQWMQGMADWRKDAAKAESDSPLSTGQSIFGVIGLALAAAATGIDGKDHVSKVVGILDKTIEREIRKKQQALKNKRQGVMDQQNVVGVMQSRFQDAEMAYQASKAAMAEEFKRELMASRETVMARRNQVKYDQAIEAVDRYGQQAKLQMDIVATQRAEAENLMRRRAAAAEAQRRADAERRARDPLLGRGGVESVAEDADWKLYVPEFGGFAADSTARAKIEDAAAIAKRLDDNISEMQRLESGGLDPGSDSAARYQSLAVETQKIMSSDKGQGAIAEGEAQRANLSLPVGDDAFHPRAAARLKATKQEINNGFRRKVDGMVRPGTIRQGYDKKGNPVMKKVLLPYAPEVQQRYEQEAIRRSRGQGSGSQSVPTGAPVRE